MPADYSNWARLFESGEIASLSKGKPNPLQRPRSQAQTGGREDAFIGQCGSDQCKLDKRRGQEGTGLPASPPRPVCALAGLSKGAFWSRARRRRKKYLHSGPEPLPRVIGNRREGWLLL